MSRQAAAHLGRFRAQEAAQRPRRELALPLGWRREKNSSIVGPSGISRRADIYIYTESEKKNIRMQLTHIGLSSRHAMLLHHRVYVYICIHIYIYIYTYSYLSVYLSMYIYIYIYV